MIISVLPAYGRDYKSGKEVLEAWQAGKDFVVNDIFSQHDGRLINKDDAPKGATIVVRFKRNTSVKSIPV